jgi:hypothetical protein
LIPGAESLHREPGIDENPTGSLPAAPSYLSTCSPCGRYDRANTSQCRRIGAYFTSIKKQESGVAEWDRGFLVRVRPDLRSSLTPSWLPLVWSQFETIEQKPRCHRTAHQCPGPETSRRLPRTGGYECLWAFTPDQVHTDAHVHDLFAVSRYGKGQRRPGVPVPDFNGIDSMPMGNFAGRQQKIDRGGNSSVTVSHRISKRFAIMAALRVRFQIQEPDDVGRSHWVKTIPKLENLTSQSAREISKSRTPVHRLRSGSH